MLLRARYITAIYNCSLDSGFFPLRWKGTKLNRIRSPARKTANTKPISQNKSYNHRWKGKKIFIYKRNNHHVFTHNDMTKKQQCFMALKSTIFTAMMVKNIVTNGLTAGYVLVIVSLDGTRGFDAAWWPAILNRLRSYECPKNLFHLSQKILYTSLSLSDYQQTPDPKRGN